MRGLGTLIVLFLFAGFLLPFMFSINMEASGQVFTCSCSGQPDGFIPCETTTSNGYIFYTYLVNVTIDFETTDGFVCQTGSAADIEVQKQREFEFTFMEPLSDIQ